MLLNNLPKSINNMMDKVVKRYLMIIMRIKLKD